MTQVTDHADGSADNGPDHPQRTPEPYTSHRARPDPPRTTINLVQLRAGQIISNTYHTVRVTGDLRTAWEPVERTAVTSWSGTSLPHWHRTGRAEARGGRPDEPVRGARRRRAVRPAISPTTTTRRCGRSPWRSVRCASPSPSLSLASRSPARADLVYLCTVIIGIEHPLSRAESI